MILEGIVTTEDPAGSLNIAPMGPRIAPNLDLSRFELRPFRQSTTYLNLKSRGEGVFHVTDDVLLIAQTAIGLSPSPDTRPAQRIVGRILADACRYYEFRVVECDESDERARFVVETVAEGRHRDFLGFNRARHAVVEAAILATRVGLIPRDQIRDDFRRLAVLVEKTGGPREREAFDLLVRYVHVYIERSGCDSASRGSS